MQLRSFFERSCKWSHYIMPHVISMNFNTNSPIGILTDSHGQVAQLSQAINYLKEKKCKTIIHLGDICDSAHIHTADECISIIQKHDVIAIRGNNDHALSVSDNPKINRSTLEYIQSLPLVIQSENLIFAHSLPFVYVLGLSCMIQSLNKRSLKLCFNSFAENAILFRGHSHQPEIVVQTHEGFKRMELHLPAKKKLKYLCPCIITCGTVMNGQCMVYYPGDQVLLGYILTTELITGQK